MVARGHKHHHNEPAWKKKGSRKEIEKEKKGAAVVKLVQKPSEVSAKVANSPPSSVYAEVIAFIETDEVALFTKKNYKMSVSISFRCSHMRPLTYVFETGACPSLIRSDVLEPSWENHIRRQEVTNLYGAYNSKLRISGTIMLHIRVGEALTRIVFGVVKQLSVPMLLDKRYTDRCARSFFPE